MKTLILLVIFGVSTLLCASSGTREKAIKKSIESKLAPGKKYDNLLKDFESFYYKSDCVKVSSLDQVKGSSYTFKAIVNCGVDNSDKPLSVVLDLWVNQNTYVIGYSKY